MSTSNEDIQLCARCGGQCCLTKPGIEAPERFNATGDLTAALRDALASGNWVLEEHRGIPYGPGETAPDPDRLIYYPRPATLAERQQPGITPLPGSGVCVFLTDRMNSAVAEVVSQIMVCSTLVQVVPFITT